MSPSSTHDPELIAILTAAATAALGQNVRVTQVRDVSPTRDECYPAPPNTPVNMTPGIAEPTPDDSDSTGKAQP